MFLYILLGLCVIFALLVVTLAGIGLTAPFLAIWTLSKGALRQSRVKLDSGARKILAGDKSTFLAVMEVNRNLDWRKFSEAAHFQNRRRPPR